MKWVLIVLIYGCYSCGDNKDVQMYTQTFDTKYACNQSASFIRNNITQQMTAICIPDTDKKEMQFKPNKDYGSQTLESPGLIKKEMPQPIIKQDMLPYSPKAEANDCNCTINKEVE